MPGLPTHLVHKFNVGSVVSLAVVGRGTDRLRLFSLVDFVLFNYNRLLALGKTYSRKKIKRKYLIYTFTFNERTMKMKNEKENYKKRKREVVELNK